MFTESFFRRIPSKRSQVLYAIACGERLTKLEIKERTALSMSTVLSSVESLASAGLVTVGEVKVKTGGKPHSVIDAASDRSVYGISYRRGTLSAVAESLAGERIVGRSLTIGEGVSPRAAVVALTDRLREIAPPPVAIALSLQCRDRDALLAELAEEYGAATLAVCNTGALAYRALWRGSDYPLTEIGIGHRVKCAYADDRLCRVADLTDLTLAPAFSREGGSGTLLAAPQVERVLRDRDYCGCYSFEGGRLFECADLAEYSRLLVRAITGVVSTVHALYVPREIRLFGDYLSQGFFDRIREARPDLPLIRDEAEDGEFAEAAAIAALVETVFS